MKVYRGAVQRGDVNSGEDFSAYFLQPGACILFQVVGSIRPTPIPDPSHNPYPNLEIIWRLL